MTKHVASTTKKFVAAGGLVFGLAGFGLFAGVGTAAATAPDTGTYDEQIENRDNGLDSNLAEDACWGGVASVPVAFEVGDPESAGCEHSRMTGSYGPNAS
jgi:hypothetical protein